METRSKAKVSGPQSRPRATSEGRTQSGTADSFNSVVTLVNPPSSTTGPTRDGKLPSRTLPPEGGLPRASSPYPRSESAGGAGGSPDGNPPGRRGQIRESGDASGGPATNISPEIAAVDSGKTLRLPDEGDRAFTL